MVQCVIICSLNLIGSFLYAYMQFFVIPEYIILTGHLTWLVINGEWYKIYVSPEYDAAAGRKQSGVCRIVQKKNLGMPVVVYMAMNATLRGDVVKMFRSNTRVGSNTNSSVGQKGTHEVSTTYQ